MEQRRQNSFRTLLRDSILCQQFHEQYLVKIFNIGDPDVILRILSKAAWDPKNRNDLDLYKVLRNHFHPGDDNNDEKSSRGDPKSELQKAWKGLKQLSHQKQEIVREASSILHHIGWFGKVNSYLSVGDNGKIVLPLFSCGAIANDAHVSIVHDFNDDDDLSAVLERGSLQNIGDKIHYDYMIDCAGDKLVNVPSNSIDLVTLNQGLHH
eukprot:CAMPEP_0194371112 /NCGR_PEP_ID=MMETSP0174-20130528/19484_1 /TAXON_ID=216777 /ORGANISM="Proboscia alata, Strain PI-D3" /LENGTH=208 /DNA_ID=CAMNT_0039148965 /DNA_START=96 /DNA_END=719 /DNA_ORIENTATION=-